MLNKVQVIGRLGKEPETKQLQNGSVCNFSVATSEKWLDKASGERKEKTEWHNITVYGKLAEICSQYLTKGSLVFVEGKLQTRKWQDQNGADRYTTEILARDMKMLGGDGGRTETPKPAPKKAVHVSEPIDFDDLPF